MFIPKCRNWDYKKGDDVVLVKELEIPLGIFTIGHKFKVKSGSGDMFTLVDKDNIVAKDVNFTMFNHDLILSDAKKKHAIELCKDIIHNALQFNCTQKTTNWEDYESYTACKLKPSDRNQCSAKMGCVIHLPEKILKKKEITNSLRKLKLENLLK